MASGPWTAGRCARDGVDRVGCRRLGFRVPTTPMGAPNLCRFGVFPFLGGRGSWAFTVPCHTGGRYSGLWVVSFLSFHPQRHQGRSRCRRIIRYVMCRLWRGRWRPSSLAVIWLQRLVVLTARPSTLDPRPSTSRGYALELFGALSLQTLRVGITTAVVVPSTKTRTPLLPAATAPPA